MNGLHPKNVIINLWRNKEIKRSDDNLSLLAVAGFFHVPWKKFKRPRKLFYLTSLIEWLYAWSKLFHLTEWQEGWVKLANYCDWPIIPHRPILPNTYTRVCIKFSISIEQHIYHWTRRVYGFLNIWSMKQNYF